MSNKKQNAVEWIHSKILLRIGLDDTDIVELRNIIEQAKAMHKEEIMKSYREGRSDQQSPRNVHFYHRNAEQLYNETFGGEDESID